MAIPPPSAIAAVSAGPGGTAPGSPISSFRTDSDGPSAAAQLSASKKASSASTRKTPPSAAATTLSASPDTTAGCAAPVRMDAAGVYYLSFLVCRDGPPLSIDRTNSVSVALREAGEFDRQRRRGQFESGRRLELGFDRKSELFAQLEKNSDRSAMTLLYNETYLLVAKIVASANQPDQVFFRVYGPEEPVDSGEPATWPVICPPVQQQSHLRLPGAPHQQLEATIPRRSPPRHHLAIRHCPVGCLPYTPAEPEAFRPTNYGLPSRVSVCHDRAIVARALCEHSATAHSASLAIERTAREVPFSALAACRLFVTIVFRCGCHGQRKLASVARADRQRNQRFDGSAHDVEPRTRTSCGRPSCRRGAAARRSFGATMSL